MQQPSASPHYRTIVISDLHLGSKWSRADRAVEFLRAHRCDTLVLCGDIIDDRTIRPIEELYRDPLFELLRERSPHTRIICVWGNHDASLGEHVPAELAFLTIEREAIYASGSRRYLVLHGDAFDRVTSSINWLSHLGHRIYSLLLHINRPLNRRRLRKGKPYFSIARAAKQRAKAAVSHLSGFERRLVAAAREQQCDGVICGHIHHPEIRMIHGIEYLNAGDWVESLSALLEDHHGHWTIYRAQP